MPKPAYYIINSITVYRLIAAPVLLIFIFTGRIEIFKWLLAFSFFTDFVDGFLARKYRVTSVTGNRLDSVADDLTVLVAIIGLFTFRHDLIKQELELIIVLFAFYVAQTVIALVKYKKITGFHTYSAKVAAIFQGVFLILTFFFPGPLYTLFYVAMITTFIDLTEEIILALMLPKWEPDVKGVYWVMKERKANN